MNTQKIRIAVLVITALATACALPAASGPVVPPKIIQTVDADFPASLAFTAVSSGEANLTVKLDAAGNLIDVLVTGYTQRDFGSEAVKAIRQWKFEPALRDGVPIESRINLHLKFASNARVVTLMPVETPALLLRQRGVRDGINLISPVKDLDSPIKVIHPATPVHPGRTANLPHGRTVVDFYIDEHGRARLPVVTESTHPAFSVAVVKALEDWRFAAPTRKGRPAIVRMQQEFVFQNGS